MNQIPVFYINLDDHTDRNQNIKNILSQIGYNNITTISAVDTRNGISKYKNLIDPKSYNKLLENNKNKKRGNHEDLTNGSIGCYLSHYSIL